jgi:hypothetical protein
VKEEKEQAAPIDIMPATLQLPMADGQVQQAPSKVDGGASAAAAATTVAQMDVDTTDTRTRAASRELELDANETAMLLGALPDMQACCSKGATRCSSSTAARGLGGERAGHGATAAFYLHSGLPDDLGLQYQSAQSQDEVAARDEFLTVVPGGTHLKSARRTRRTQFTPYLSKFSLNLLPISI